MYNEFSSIDDLMEAVRKDKHAEGASSFVQNRYPVRFVLFDNFRDSYAFIVRLIQEMKIKVEEIQGWIDADYPDIIMSHSRLAESLSEYIKGLDGESRIVAPFSELARFYNNKDDIEYDTLIRTVKAIEALPAGWEKKQRIYIPIIGLEGKMSFFFDDTQSTIWYMRSEDQELSYRLILTNQTTYDVKHIDSQYTVIQNVKEWLDFWRNQDYHGKPNIICTSKAIYANAEYAQPDNAFSYCPCDNVYKFLTEGLGLKFQGLNHRDVDDKYWEELAAEIDLEEKFDFKDFFSKHFSTTNVDGYKSFVKLWFEYSDGFSRWLLVNTYINNVGTEDYLGKVLQELDDYSDRSFVEKIALLIDETNGKDMDVRRYCLNEAHKRNIQLTVDTQNRLRKKLEEIAQPNNYHAAIQLFSPMSVMEKEMAINWLGAGHIQEKDVLAFYPELYYYLEPSTGTLDPNQVWVLDYMDKYKRAKITDEYSDVVRELVGNYNGNSIEFNKWYQKFQTTHHLLYNRGDIEVFYWIDGLGIDWIPLITKLIADQQQEKVFLNDVKIARAILPSKTDVNKESLLKLVKGDVRFEKVGDIDKMAHQNTNVYPNNIINEIDSVCNAIHELLRKYTGKKIAIVSDHGMTYLSQRVVGLNLGGFEYHHYGRYATRTTGNATSDNNYFILDDGKTVCALNHSSLGKKIDTGMGAHGGCTPEEVLVPIFIISSSPNNKTWDATLLNDEITGSNPVVELRIIGLTSLDAPKVEYNGKMYKLISKGNNLFVSEPMELTEEETSIRLYIGEYSEIKSIKVNTGSKEDDLFGGMGLDI